MWAACTVTVFWEKAEAAKSRNKSSFLIVRSCSASRSRRLQSRGLQFRRALKSGSFSCVLEFSASSQHTDYRPGLPRKTRRVELGPEAQKAAPPGRAQPP